MLGHEGAGVVEEVGPAVTSLSPGDSVVLSFGHCGNCAQCASGLPGYCASFFGLNFGGSDLDGSTALEDADGNALHDHFFAQSSFATYALARESNAVRVPAGAPLELLGPLGCGIQTGAGAVINSLKVRPGTSFVGFGAGAVGLSAVMAAKVAGATTIVAVDVVPERLELAKELGATHTVNSREVDLIEAVREATGGGARVRARSPPVVRRCSPRPSRRSRPAGRSVSSARRNSAPSEFDVNNSAARRSDDPRHRRGRLGTRISSSRS